MKKIVTIGEVMLRLSPPGNQRFFQANHLELEFGGSEANVASALAYWGLEVSHLTAFPDHELGWAAAGKLRKYGINTQFISFLPGRMGIYFLEQGAMQRSSQVIYDRKDSSFSKFTGAGLDWNLLLNGVDCVHWSGISPALSQEVADLTLTLLEQANARKILVCGDLNYRSNLWNYGKVPHEVMPKLMDLTQVMIAGTRDFNQCLKKNFGSFQEVEREVFDLFPKLNYLVKTDRESYSSSANSLTATLHTRKKAYSSRTYELTHIVDRVGSGDAFAAGLLYGLLHFKPEEAIEFAMAAGALKHSIPGDVLTCTLQEVQELVAGGGNGKIKR